MLSYRRKSQSSVGMTRGSDGDMAMAYTLTSSLLTDVHRDSSNHENRLAVLGKIYSVVTGNGYTTHPLACRSPRYKSTCHRFLKGL